MKSSNKIVTISLIFFTTMLGSFFIALIAHNKIPTNYHINYQLLKNNEYTNSLRHLDKIMFLNNVKDRDFDKTFEIYVDENINDIILKLVLDEKNKELFKFIENFGSTTSFIKFETSKLDNIDKRVDQILLAINDDLKNLVLKKIDILEERIIEREFFLAKSSYNELLENIERIENLQQNPYASLKDEMNKKILTRILTYYFLNNEMTLFIKEPINNKNLSEGLIISGGIILENLFKDDLEYSSLETILTILEYIKVEKEKKLKTFDTDFKLKNFLYTSIEKEKLVLSKTSILSKSKAVILNKKPSIIYMTLSFLFAGFLLSLLFIYFYLNLKTLINMTNKKLKALLYLK